MPPCRLGTVDCSDRRTGGAGGTLQQSIKPFLHFRADDLALPAVFVDGPGLDEAKGGGGVIRRAAHNNMHGLRAANHRNTHLSNGLRLRGQFSLGALMRTGRPSICERLFFWGVSECYRANSCRYNRFPRFSPRATIPLHPCDLRASISVIAWSVIVHTRAHIMVIGCAINT